MTTIYLAEDQAMLNSALATLLNLENDLEVIGTATDGKTALEEIIQQKPDVAILDIEMPQMTGLEVATNLRMIKQDLKIIILTVFAQENYFEIAVKAEVNAYLLKDNPTDELIKTIHEILGGKIVYSPELVITVLNAEKNPLTDREMDIVDKLNQGFSNKEISKAVFLSEGTVRNYISSILSKTGAHSRIEALNTIKRNKWI